MATSVPSRDEILERLARIVAESLRVDAARVTREANLQDLGAESLDLLEITMQVEDDFDVIIPQKNILDTGSDVFGPGVLVADGRLTAQGVEFLRSRMPELEAGAVAVDMPVGELAPIFQRVDTWVRMIEGLLKESPRACPACGTAFPKAIAGRLTCARCATQVDLPSGDDLNRRWVEEYRRVAAPAAGSAAPES